MAWLSMSLAYKWCVVLNKDVPCSYFLSQMFFDLGALHRTYTDEPLIYQCCKLNVFVQTIDGKIKDLRKSDL